MRQYIGPPVNMTRLPDVPAMPEEIFSAESIQWLFSLTDRVDAQEACYDQSLAVIYGVRNVPLKPDPANVEAKYQEVLAESRDGMTHFFPKKIVPLNIGSNAGLVEVVRNLWEEHKASASAQNYKFVVADTNIFWRSIKVCSLQIFC